MCLWLLIWHSAAALAWLTAVAGDKKTEDRFVSSYLHLPVEKIISCRAPCTAALSSSRPWRRIEMGWAAALLSGVWASVQPSQSGQKLAKTFLNWAKYCGRDSWNEGFTPDSLCIWDTPLGMRGWMVEGEGAAAFLNHTRIFVSTDPGWRGLADKFPFYILCLWQKKADFWYECFRFW